MNSQEFCSSFRFVKITFNRPHQTDRLTGEERCGAAEIPPYGVMILKKEGEDQ